MSCDSRCGERDGSEGGMKIRRGEGRRQVEVEGSSGSSRDELGRRLWGRRSEAASGLNIAARRRPTDSIAPGYTASSACPAWDSLALVEGDIADRIRR